MAAEVKHLQKLFQNDQRLRDFLLDGVCTTGNKLGTGAYGAVEEVDMGGIVCAGKKIHEILVQPGERRIVEKYLEECQLMSDLRHPHIVHFVGICFLPDCRLPVLVMEKLHCSLDDFLTQHPPLPDGTLDVPLRDKWSVMVDVAKGLHFLHGRSPQPVIHRDLTAKNILLTSSLVGKISDFGNARIVDIQPDKLGRTLTRVPGTPMYMPPEAFDSRCHYGPRLDLFSFGHLALYTLIQVFPGELLPSTYTAVRGLFRQSRLLARTEVERRHEYFILLYQQLGKKHPLVRLIERCLANEAKDRPSAEEVLQTLEQMDINDPRHPLTRDMETDEGHQVTDTGREEFEDHQKMEGEPETQVGSTTGRNNPGGITGVNADEVESNHPVETGIMVGLLQDKRDELHLHKLCQDGNLKKVQEFVRNMNGNTLHEKLGSRKGVFGYTPLHEAVVSGNHKVLDFLLGKGGDVNCRAISGYTPLHLAAGSGHAECVRVLLRQKADISMTDEYQKTPKQTAELSSKGSIVRLLRSEEIIKEVETNGDNLTELLRIRADQLEPDCLKRALHAAVNNDNPWNVGKLIIKGADNINECLRLAKENRKPHARAMLLLIRAALDGSRNLVLKLFGEPATGLQDVRQYQDDGFPDVQKAVVSGKVSTVVPIEIARRNGHPLVQEELLLKTDVNQEEGTVYWHGLRLLVLDILWLTRIHWVKRLHLAANGFRMLPNEMGTYLKQVMKLDLQHNELTTIPRCILELPSLLELNLAYNKLVEIPDVPEWSSCLAIFDLSHNQLTSMPVNALAPAIHALNISYNKFRQVPLCICSFTTLHSVDISENPDILILPTEMGRLGNLSRLNLMGLKKLRDPPRNIQRDCRDCIRYLNNKLRCAKGFYRMKLMVLGLANRGKTTLVAKLQGRDCGNESTGALEISEWVYRPRLGKKQFHFSIWDFGGQEEYYATHQCFLSPRSLYLLLFNLKHGEKGVNELKPWLNNIALRAPRSWIIIIGTHLDEVQDDERHKVDEVLQKVADLADAYHHKVEVVEVIPVGLKNRLENIGILKEDIYNHAEKYKTRAGQPIMGQKIPASYHALDKQLESLQSQVRNGVREPIMHAEEFKTMVQLMGLADIQDDDELKTASLFLTDVGSLLHYDDRSHNLHELYFIDPRWLCNMMSKVVTIKERNPFVKGGILHCRNIPQIFKDQEFPWQYIEQYLTLLDRFEIALPLDNKRILIPSMLPDERPSVMDEEQSWEGEPLYSRYIIFASADTPPGFWGRLLSQIMFSVAQITFALDKATTLSPENSSPQHRDFSPLFDSVPEPGNIRCTAATPLNLTDYHLVTDANSSPTSLSMSLGMQVELSPGLLPNFPPSLPFQGLADTFDPSLIKLDYWRYGLCYSDPEVLFRVEKLLDSKQPISRGNKDRDGVLIVTSPNNTGKKITGQLVDLVVSLVKDWYPGLQEYAGPAPGLEQRVPCWKCLKMGRRKPFEFKVKQCLKMITAKQTTMECQFELHDPAKNHTVHLTDIVPDLLLQDINPEFLLDSEDLMYTEDDASLLGKGGYGKVYRGQYHGKPIAIKKYLTRNEDAFYELRSEAMLLQKSHHPCLVCLVGGCIHPMVALVMEEAPMGSLERPLIKKKQPVHRLTLYRMAAEVAAALRYLHQNGIILRGVKAANVLLWTLDYQSLCHCKVTDFGIATYRSPVGTKGLIGTKGFIAPEVLYIGKRKEYSVYDHNADIFSFGMFLYQLIARRHPYHDILPQRIDTAVQLGERPKFQDITQAETAYHYLTQLMKMCWEDNPRKRPSTDTIITKLCSSPMQSVMCVHPVHSKFSLRHICALTPVDFRAAGVTRQSSELWVCCDGVEGAEVSIYITNTMVKVCKNFIKENQVQCISLCGDHMWVGSRAGIDYSVIDIFSIGSRELVHNIRMRANSVSCITCSDKTVYLGTLEGYCFSFCRDIKQIQANSKPDHYKYVSEHAVDGIVATHQCIWVSHTCYICFLNPDSLVAEKNIQHQQDALVGQLFLSQDNNTVWSAHLGGVIISAWDANRKVHKFDINVHQAISNVAETKNEQDFVITAICPALDTIWVGLAGGHIMVFENQDLLTYYHPYKECVLFLSCIPFTGPCEMEQALVVSGAKGYQAVVPDMQENTEVVTVDEKGEPVGKAGIMVLWEAYDAKTTRQIKLVEEHAPNCFDSHSTMKRMISRGEFKDGTHILQKSNESIVSYDLPISTASSDAQFSGDLSLPTQEEPETIGLLYDSLSENSIQFGPPGEPSIPGYGEPFPSLEPVRSASPPRPQALKDSTYMYIMQKTEEATASNSDLTVGTVSSASHLPSEDLFIPAVDTENSDSPKDDTVQFTQSGGALQSRSDSIGELAPSSFEQRSPLPSLRAHTATTTISHETFNVQLPEQGTSVLVLCPKPVILQVLLNELQVSGKVPQEGCHVEYHLGGLGGSTEIKTQDQLETYLKLEKRPQLVLFTHLEGALQTAEVATSKQGEAT